MDAIAAEPKWNVRTELLAVRVPQETGLKLRPALRDSNTVEAAVSNIYAMISRGEATLVGAPIVWSESGRSHLGDGTFPRRDESWTIEEYRYGTEFEFPPNGQPWSAKRIKSADEKFKERLYQFMIVPTTFETRNLSLSVSVDAQVLADGRTISLGIDPSHVTFEGFRRVIHSGPLNGTWREGQPSFRTVRADSQIVVFSGKWQLLSVNVLRDRAPQMEFFLVRATAIPIFP
jgi:hypothetical protein